MDADELELEEIRERIRREIAACKMSESKRDDVAARLRVPTGRIAGTCLPSAPPSGTAPGAPFDEVATGEDDRLLDRLRNSVTDALRRHFGNKKLTLQDAEPKPGFFRRLFRKQGAFNKAVIAAWRRQLTFDQKMLSRLQATHEKARQIEPLSERLVDEFSGLHDALRTEREDRIAELERLREQIRNEAWTIRNLAEEFGTWRRDVSGLRAQTSDDERSTRALQPSLERGEKPSASDVECFDQNNPCQPGNGPGSLLSDRTSPLTVNPVDHARCS